MDQHIRHHDDDSGGKFVYDDAAKEIGGMYYSYDGDGKLIIDHTEVDAAYEGRGIGRKLLEGLVEFARLKKIKVIPRCTYAIATLRKVTEWQDVLDESWAK